MTEAPDTRPGILPTEAPEESPSTPPAKTPDTRPGTPSLRKGFLRLLAFRPLTFRSVFLWLAIGVALFWSLAALTLVAARWIDPPTTAVQFERRLEAWIHNKPYRDRCQFVPLRQISPDLQHAVIAAEDARFYQHHGFDWHQIQIDAQDDMEGGRVRGASTLTQQLVKNLFFGTGRSLLRKGAEATLVPVAEFVLGKQRILELYLNVVFMARSPRLAPGTEPPPAISTANRGHDSPRFCPLPSGDGLSA